MNTNGQGLNTKLTTGAKWSCLSLAAIAAVGAGLLFLPVTASAVSGQCANCHTMHNSQNGDPMTLDGSATPNDLLLRGDCITCHTAPSGLQNDGLSTHAPWVNQVDAPTYGTNGTDATSNTLAGGTFYWVDQGADAKGHNVSDLGTGLEDDELLNAPPGKAAASHFDGATQLTCAGIDGCHGDTTVEGSMAGVRGGHHANATGAITAASTTVGGSFRFLVGVTGYEDADFEYRPSATEHNQYQGIARGDDSTNTTTSISSLCGQCHSDFHNGTNTVDGGTWGSPWVRHPTDFDMGAATGGEYASYGGGGAAAAYQVEAPVGSSDVSAVLSTVNMTSANGTAIVLCISCHRAHGTPNDDLLRWDYSTMVAGGGAGNIGCFNCHTTKDDAP